MTLLYNYTNIIKEINPLWLPFFEENEEEILDILDKINKNENTNEYSIDITLPLVTNDELAFQFSKTSLVVSQNSQTGYEVDAARATAVTNYLVEINR